MTKVLCDVYKSRKMDEAYLYVSRKDALSRVPEALLTTFGKPELAMTLMLSADKKLARADAAKVLQQMDEQGFYLQVPPPRENNLPDLFCKMDKE
ncbi:YcgL domain-containing protein [Venatoribacter cucullus]|uniref:YcgL domain-containing protein GJQ55_06970 n=1 Tax=Venatoribacter cucullus TaxID=2661630 RepID=A0A9E8FKR9_9GAMM|nr:YcgL domain-containing protein [Venatoribacter cucullus]QQD21557.1 hypothetical protein GJQ54_07140 [Oceanospirillaceae bacterium ASx5O]QQD24234.1 hypothetical protein GJQ55_06970 [Venatoribacter cucullus]UZK03579.1 hypothetical protein GAY96_06565 [Venatoribacter cucullus]